MIKVLLEAPLLTRSGYGEHSRLVFRSLITNKNLKIFIDPLNWGSTSWISDFSEERQQIEQCISNQAEVIRQAQETGQQISYDIQIRVGIPNEFEKKAPYSVCVTAGIETDRVSANWLMKTHQGIDKIIVPSNHSKQGFDTTSYEAIDQSTNTEVLLECNCEVDVVPYPVKILEPDHLDFSLSTKFNFLCVALIGIRKNIEKMIKLFLDEFGDNPDVGLVLKTAFTKGSVMDRQKTISHFNSILKQYQDRKCKIYLLHGDLTDEQIHSLYVREDIQAYMTATHGEGYGLPIFEAAYSGMPVIATDWSAHLDFLSADYKENGKIKNKKLFAKVDFEMEDIPQAAVWKDILVQGSRWAKPKGLSFRKQIRNVYKNYGMYKKWANALKESVQTTHKNDKILQQMHDSIMSGLDSTVSAESEEVLVL